MSKVKQRILDLLQISLDDITEPVSIKDVLNKLKSFFFKINMNTIKLYILFTSDISQNSIICSNSKTYSFEEYIDLRMPLYLIHFLKFCEEKYKNESKGVHINNFNNLTKEYEYQKERESNQIIIMWKRIKNGKFKILSFLSKYFNDYNFDEKKYFIYEVGGDTIKKIENSWEKYNKITINELVDKSKLITLSDGINKMLTCNEN